MSRSTFPVPAEIDPTGSTDVTAVVNAFIRSVPDGGHSGSGLAPSVIRFKDRGRYRLDGSVVVEGRHGLAFEGEATLDGSRNRNGQARHFWIRHSRDISVRGLTVLGANPNAGTGNAAFVQPMQWQHAFAVWGSEGILLEEVQGYDVYGDFVDVQPMRVTRVPVPCRDVTIRGCRFERNGRQGIAVGGAEHVLIERNHIGGVRHSLLDLEPQWPTLAISDIRFVENTMGDVRHLWLANGGLCNPGVSEIWITDNVAMEGASMGGLEVRAPLGCTRRGPFHIERNVLRCRQGSAAALKFTRAHDVHVRDNQLTFAGDRRLRVFADLYDSALARVDGNRITRADRRNTVKVLRADPYSSDWSESGNSVS